MKQQNTRPRVRSRAKDAIKRFKFKHPNALKNIARVIVASFFFALVAIGFILVHYVVLLIL